MKKAIFVILLLLPIFLMIIISVTGRLIVMYIPTPVEGVYFADADGNEISSIEVGKNKTLTVNVVITPELASNQKFKLTYTLNDDNPEFEYNAETGELRGLEYGSGMITVVTDDKKKKAELEVKVADRNVSAVKLNATELELSIGESFTLTASIEPITAVNRIVTYSSSDPSRVSVSSTGRINAIAATDADEPVIITATAQDGGATAQCLVTVLPSLPPLAFYKIGESTPVILGEIFVKTQTIDLMDYLRYDEDLMDASEIEFVRSAGQGVLDGSNVTFAASGNYINVVARVVREDKVVYSYSAIFRYIP